MQGQISVIAIKVSARYPRVQGAPQIPPAKMEKAVKKKPQPPS
jgi:hypothetical protein